MNRHHFSYTTIDPATRCARTFSVTCESRSLALTSITSAVRKVNRARLSLGPAARLLPLPTATALEASEAATRSPNFVSAFA